MGQIAGKLTHCTENLRNTLSRKRTRSDADLDAATTGAGDGTSHTEQEPPKRRKLQSTTTYIYNALYKQQRNSDICVRALNRSWRLHKIYLAQSPYFEAMFNGSWAEASQERVHLQILDEQITEDALDAVFGSLYSDEIDVGRENAVSILATATLLQLQSIIDKCAECMNEHICADTAVQHYEAACRYGLLSVKRASFQWLLINLLNSFHKTGNYKQLRKVSIELMTELVGSRQLYVLQTEFSLYQLLRLWMFLQLHPKLDPTSPETLQRVRDAQRLVQGTVLDERSTTFDVLQWIYFGQREDTRSFLQTPEGAPYVRTFRQLRTHYLGNHFMDLRIVQNDNIIPKDWLFQHMLSNWETLLRVDHATEGEPHDVSESEFDAYAMRCSRFLSEPGFHKWRWTGFNFGVDIVYILDAGELRVKRLHRHETQRMFSMRTKRNFMVRLNVASLDAARKPTTLQSTEIQTLSLERNEEAVVMKLEPRVTFPLIISANMLVVPPANLDFKSLAPQAEEEPHVSNAALPSAPIFEFGGNCLERPATPPLLQESDDSAIESSMVAGSRTNYSLAHSTPNSRPRIGGGSGGGSNSASSSTSA